MNFYSSSVFCFFLPLQMLSLYLGGSPFLPLGTDLQLSRSRWNMPWIWNPPELCGQSPSPQDPRALCPLISALISQFCYGFICPWAPPRQKPCLIHICIPLAQPPCSVNVWWMTEGKNVHHWKIAHQSLVHQRCREMFSSNVVSQCQYPMLSWFILKHWKFRRACRGWKKGILFVKEKIRL